MGSAASNGPATLAACQKQFMQELFADTLSFAGELCHTGGCLRSSRTTVVVRLAQHCTISRTPHFILCRMLGDMQAGISVLLTA